jgi:hypothetical protein
MLRAVRSSVGENTVIAAGVPPDWTPLALDVPMPPQIAPGTVWETDYKQSVALLVNDLVVMPFNTGFTSAGEYTAWVAYQTQQYVLAADELDAGTRIYIGLPAYDDEPRHDPAVENITTAAAGILEGLSRVGAQAAAFVRGGALYAEWTMDDSDWAAWRSGWVERR